jgi:hypothetical protein
MRLSSAELKLFSLIPLNSGGTIMISHEKLMHLYQSCMATTSCLLPNRVRETLLKCALENGDEPSHSEDDPTPETLLYEAAEKITGLLENLGHFDSDGMESLPEWEASEKFVGFVREVVIAKGTART